MSSSYQDLKCISIDSYLMVRLGLIRPKGIAKEVLTIKIGIDDVW